MKNNQYTKRNIKFVMLQNSKKKQHNKKIKTNRIISKGGGNIIVNSLYITKKINNLIKIFNIHTIISSFEQRINKFKKFLEYCKNNEKIKDKVINYRILHRPERKMR